MPQAKTTKRSRPEAKPTVKKPTAKGAAKGAANDAAKAPAKGVATAKAPAKPARKTDTKRPVGKASAPSRSSSATASSPKPAAKPAAAPVHRHPPEPKAAKTAVTSPKSQAAPPAAPKVPPPAPATPLAKVRLSKHDLGDLRELLLIERTRLSGVVEGLRQESLVRHDEVNHEEDGTDAFIRLSGLDRASNEQTQIVKVDEALRAIDEGLYGQCERCGGRIEKPRLQALPFVKTCIKCQSEAENGSRGRVTARQRLWD